MIPRVFVASLATETNSFSPLRTDLTDFHESFYAPPGKHPQTPTLCSAVFPALRTRAAKGEITLIEGTATWAEPGGLINSATWQTLRDEILTQLQAALPVDAILLGLHGAMIAEGELDPEGALIAACRSLAPTAKIGVTFDPHSHLSPRRVQNADIITVFKEFPHTDFVRTAEDCVRLTLAALAGEIAPVISTFDAKMIEVLPTSREPMRGFVDRMLALEASGEALSVSLIHGFMAGDSPDLGTQVIVITDGDKAKGQALATRLGREVFSFRGRTRPEFLTPTEALTRAATAKRPTVLADVWDNPGGGVAGDSTILLSEILSRNLQNTAFATIWDPMAVRLCFAAGQGATLDLRFGGKTSAQAGPPIDARVSVKHLQRAATQSFGTSIVPLGDCAVIAVKGTQIILNTNRAQTFSPDLFSNLGIDPKAQDLLIVKSTNHFHGAFAPIAGEILYCAVDGPYPSDPTKTRYRTLTRAIWPIVENPHAL